MVYKYNHYSHQRAKSLLSLGRPVTRQEIRLLFPSRTWAYALYSTIKGQKSAFAWLQAAYTLRSERFERKAACLKNKVNTVPIPTGVDQGVSTSSPALVRAVEVALAKCRKVEAAVTRKHDTMLKRFELKIEHLQAKIADCRIICDELDHLRSSHASGIERRDAAMTKNYLSLVKEYVDQETVRRTLSQHSIDMTLLFYGKLKNEKAIKMLCFGRKYIYAEEDAKSFDAICKELQCTCGPTFGFNGDSCGFGIGLFKSLARMLYLVPALGGPVANWQKLSSYYDTYVASKIDNEKWNPFA